MPVVSQSARWGWLSLASSLTVSGELMAVQGLSEIVALLAWMSVAGQAERVNQCCRSDRWAPPMEEPPVHVDVVADHERTVQAACQLGFDHFDRGSVR